MSAGYTMNAPEWPGPSLTPESREWYLSGVAHKILVKLWCILMSGESMDRKIQPKGTLRGECEKAPEGEEADRREGRGGA